MAKLFSWHKSECVWANLDQENKKNQEISPKIEKSDTLKKKKKKN